MQQVSTGIKGLDTVLCGGLLLGSSVLIEGSPGCGKTTLGVQAIVEGVNSGEPGLILTFEQFPEQIYRDASRFGWDLQLMEKENQLKVICTSPQVISEQLLQASGPLNQLIDSLGIKRILIDSFTHFRQITVEETKLRKLMFSLINSLKRKGLTVFFTKEYLNGDHTSFEEYLVDTIISLSYKSTPNEGRRRMIEVLKSRGHEHLPGRHTLRFGPNGLQVFPRQSLDLPVYHMFEGVLRTEIAGLDDLLGGGIPRGSNVLLCGTAGVGKTTLSLQVINNVLQDTNTKALLLLHEELPEYIFKRADVFGWNLRNFAKKGQLIINYQDFNRIDIDEYFYRMAELIEKNKPSIVVIDTLPTLLHTVSYDLHLVTEKIARLTRLIKYYGCTSLLICPSPYGSQQIGRFGIEESFCDGLIILGTRSINGKRKRHIEIYKLRNQKHVTGEYRMEITDEGIRILYV